MKLKIPVKRYLSNTSVFLNKKLQAPNRNKTWSLSQQSKEKAMTGPRFEQTDFSVQPAPLSAQELISKVPVKFVDSRVVSCDGGELGHPKVYINLDQGKATSCGYCGQRFQLKH
jgi:NADH dehydrogenase (ubiquinone) Fe-S protein 6